MTAYVALLRAINVGGTGKLPMADLRRLCESAGFRHVATYIQSGNVVFESALPEPKVKDKLRKALTAKMGKPFGVLVRTRAELDAILAHNPFRTAAPNRLLILFLDNPPARDALLGVVIPGRESVNLHGREVFIQMRIRLERRS